TQRQDAGHVALREQRASWPGFVQGLHQTERVGGVAAPEGCLGASEVCELFVKGDLGTRALRCRCVRTEVVSRAGRGLITSWGWPRVWECLGFRPGASFLGRWRRTYLEGVRELPQRARLLVAQLGRVPEVTVYARSGE